MPIFWGKKGTKQKINLLKATLNVHIVFIWQIEMHTFLNQGKRCCSTSARREKNWKGKDHLEASTGALAFIELPLRVKSWVISHHLSGGAQGRDEGERSMKEIWERKVLVLPSRTLLYNQGDPTNKREMNLDTFLKTAFENASYPFRLFSVSDSGFALYT